MRNRPDDGWNLYVEWSNWTFGFWWSWRKINRRQRQIGIEVGPFQWMWQRTDPYKPRPCSRWEAPCSPKWGPDA